MKKNAEIGTANVVGTSPASDQTDGSATATRRGRRLGIRVAAVALVAAGCGTGGNAKPSPSPENTSTATTATSSPAHNVPESGDPGYKGKPDAPDGHPEAWDPDFTLAANQSTQTFTETRQYDTEKADLFRDFKHLSGVGPQVPVDKTLEVNCTVFDPNQWGNSTQGVFYHVVSSRDIAGVDGKDYFTPANTFYNQPDIGGKEQNNLYDPQVPACNIEYTSGTVPPRPAPLPPIHGTLGN